jgi:hypothetical protein
VLEGEDQPLSGGGEGGGEEEPLFLGGAGLQAQRPAGEGGQRLAATVPEEGVGVAVAREEPVVEADPDHHAVVEAAGLHEIEDAHASTVRVADGQPLRLGRGLGELLDRRRQGLQGLPQGLKRKVREAQGAEKALQLLSHRRRQALRGEGLKDRQALAKGLRRLPALAVGLEGLEDREQPRYRVALLLARRRRERLIVRAARQAEAPGKALDLAPSAQPRDDAGRAAPSVPEVDIDCPGRGVSDTDLRTAEEADDRGALEVAGQGAEEGQEGRDPGVPRQR